jgi:hypothetical protein
VDPYPKSKGFRSKKAKRTHKNGKIEEISCFQELNVFFRGLKAPLASLRHKNKYGTNIATFYYTTIES